MCKGYWQGHEFGSLVTSKAEHYTLVACATDIYAAREKDIYNVNSELLAERIRATHPDKDIRYVSDMALIAETVDAETEEGDLVIVMGAGDIYKVGRMMVKEEEA